MPNNKTFIICILCLLFCLCSAWGFFSHEHINKMAVFTLPRPMIGFFKRNIDYLEKNAVNPDKRRYIDKEEAPRHYLDADHYGQSPFDSIPLHWRDAVLKYSEDTLKAYGIVPWHIQTIFNRLTRAFEERDSLKILRTAADLGHYIADAHVPLHTTENYNGQLTGQYGIHGFWESRLPELFSKDYSFFIGRADYISNPLETSWSILKASFAALDSVLLFEKELTAQFGEDEKFSLEYKGRSQVKVYSIAFSKAYHQKLNGMVERRMRAATKMVGSFWYTAWVNAGQPNLDHLTKYSAFNDSIGKVDSILLKPMLNKTWIGRSED